MIYQGFAYIYDQLMSDAPYDEWVKLIQTSIGDHLPGTKKILDVGCGTGAITLKLAEQQFDVTGVDISGDMLTVAQAKLDELHVNARFLLQDMRELSGFMTPFDLVTICCDSLNYLENEADVKATFSAVYEQLKVDGLFIFDVHSVYKINHIFADATFADQDEDVSFIWKSYIGDEPNSIEHDMTFFVHEGETYRRYDELHVQKTYSINEYISWLEATSFELLNICGDFDLTNKPSSEAERIFFIARKKA